MVSLSSGTSNFTKDVLFGYAIYNLADAIKERYRRKLDLYDQENMSDQETAAYNILKNQYFLVTWHFLLISLFNVIVYSWKNQGKDIDFARDKIVGNDWNRYFANHLNEEFNLCENKDYSIILDDSNPTNTFSIFWKWTDKIIEELTDKIEAAKDKPEFSFRWYIDQRNETFLELKTWINSIYAKGPKKWSETFPIE